MKQVELTVEDLQAIWNYFEQEKDLQLEGDEMNEITWIFQYILNSDRQPKELNFEFVKGE